MTLFVTTAAIGPAPSAQAGQLYGDKVFTKIDTYYETTDSNGTFTAQVDWASAQNTVRWSFRPAPTVRAIAIGPMDCQAGSMQLPDYHDNHPGIPVDYYWHSKVQGSFFNTEYVVWGGCTLPVQEGGQTGQARLSFYFRYVLQSLE